MNWHRNTQTGAWTTAAPTGGHYRAWPARGGWNLSYFAGSQPTFVGWFPKLNGMAGAKWGAQFDQNRRQA